MVIFLKSNQLYSKRPNLVFVENHFIVNNFYSSNSRKMAFHKIYLVASVGHGRKRDRELISLYREHMALSPLLKWTFQAENWQNTEASIASIGYGGVTKIHMVSKPNSSCLMSADAQWPITKGNGHSSQTLLEKTEECSCPYNGGFIKVVRRSRQVLPTT